MLSIQSGKCLIGCGKDTKKMLERERVARELLIAQKAKNGRKN